MDIFKEIEQHENIINFPEKEIMKWEDKYYKKIQDTKLQNEMKRKEIYSDIYDNEQINIVHDDEKQSFIDNIENAEVKNAIIDKNIYLSEQEIEDKIKNHFEKDIDKHMGSSLYDELDLDTHNLYDSDIIDEED